MIRHTPVAGPPGRCVGSTDAPLDEHADAAITAVRARLGQAPDSVRLVVSSPARRCRRLAESIASDVTIDARLGELDFGRWEGRMFDDIPATEIAAWNDDLANARPPGGESLRELQARAVASIEEHSAPLPGALHGPDQLVVVTHGGVIRVLVAWLLDLDLASTPRLDVANGSISRLCIDGQVRRVVSLNEPVATQRGSQA